MHFIEQSKFMVVTSLLKFIPASFLKEIIKRNRFCCSVAILAASIWIFLHHLFHIESSYPKYRLRILTRVV